MDGKVIIGTELDTKSFENEIKEVERKLEDLTNEYDRLSNLDGFDEQSNAAIHLRSEIEKTTNKLQTLNKKQDDLKQNNSFQFISSSIGNIGKSVEGVIKKIGRWTLAIFGIRSAYMFVRQAMSTLTQYNDQLAVDVEYLRFAIASTLQPVIERIIQLTYKLLSLIGAVTKSLTGKNIFKNAGIEKFSKGMASSAKSAKELNKQLAGFDEMNVLQNTSSAGTGGVGGAGATPSMDLSLIDEQTEEYVEKMKNVADTVTSFWEEDWKEYFNNATGNWGSFIKGLLLTLEGFYKVFKGIFEFIGGIIDVFVGIFTGDVDKMKQGWDKMVKGLVDILVGVLDIIVGLIVTFVGFFKGMILDLWDGIKGIASGVGKWINDNVIKPIGNFFSGLWSGIVNGVKGAFNGIKNIFGSIVNFFKGIISTILGFFKNLGTSVGNVIGGAFKAVINGVLSAIESILNKPITAINGLMDVINKVPGINLKKLSTFKLPRLARGGIVNNPGPGVMMGSYIAGENGPEAVLPLTDDTLQRLANMIPITVNVTNTMNGRVISRELQRVQNESNFAFNR